MPKKQKQSEIVIPYKPCKFDYFPLNNKKITLSKVADIKKGKPKHSVYLYPGWGTLEKFGDNNQLEGEALKDYIDLKLEKMSEEIGNVQSD